MSYSDWLYNQLGGGNSGGSGGGYAGLKDVFPSWTYYDDDNSKELTLFPESGKRYIIDVEDEGMLMNMAFVKQRNITDECQIWLRVSETVIENDWLVFSTSIEFNTVNEPDLSPRSTASEYRYFTISIQNNLAVCSEFTLGDENNIWYGDVD